MEILSAILDFFYVLDSKNIIREKWNVFNDTNEYKGERILAFFSFLILVVFYLFMIFVVCYAIYISFTSHK